MWQDFLGQYRILIYEKAFKVKALEDGIRRGKIDRWRGDRPHYSLEGLS